jgi:DNA ligase-4
MVVFFDILLLDGNSLLWESYETRRTKLEDVITTIPGFSMLAERTPINMRRGLESGSRTLRNCFARSIADCKGGTL